MKICPVGAEKFHADRQTGMTKTTAPFRNFAKAPKNSAFCSHSIYILRTVLTINNHYFLYSTRQLYSKHSVFFVQHEDNIYYLPYNVFCNDFRLQVFNWD